MHRATSRAALPVWARALPYGAALVVMAFFGAVLAHLVSREPDRLGWVLLDVAAGGVALSLLHWRDRWPYPIALVSAGLTVISSLAVGPALVAYVVLCTHRRWLRICSVALVLWSATVATALVPRVNTQVLLVSVSVMSILLVTLTIGGLYIRSYTELAEARRQQREAAARRDRERLEQVRLAERVRIAREMHDVLAHRISLLALHAGALAHRTDLTPDEVRAAATVIADNAHQSLNELRTTLGSLREDTATTPPPALGDLSALVDEVREAGQRVHVTDELGDHDELPPQLGRHVFRTVQEALTNARKHAPGAEVSVRLTGRPGEHVRVRVSNPLPAVSRSGSSDGRGQDTTGGLGLLGLAERMQLVGGTLHHTVRDGAFVLTAEVPWRVEP